MTLRVTFQCLGLNKKWCFYYYSTSFYYYILTNLIPVSTNYTECSQISKHTVKYMYVAFTLHVDKIFPIKRDALTASWVWVASFKMCPCECVCSSQDDGGSAISELTRMTAILWSYFSHFPVLFLYKHVQEQAADPTANKGPWSLDFKADHMLTDSWPKASSSRQTNALSDNATTRPGVKPLPHAVKCTQMNKKCFRRAPDSHQHCQQSPWNRIAH